MAEAAMHLTVWCIIIMIVVMLYYYMTTFQRSIGGMPPSHRRH